MEAPVVPNPNSELPSPPSPVSADPAARRPSAQLARWSRTRALRAGRRVDRPVEEGTSLSPPVSPSTPLSSKFPAVLIADPEEKEGSSEAAQGEGAAAAAANTESVIYMVSDGTGSTLEHAIGAALGQFENRRRCAVSTHLFSGINDVDNLLDIIRQAAKDGALLLYTLANPALAKPAKQACQMWNVPFVDILGPTTEAIASQLGISPSGIPRSERKTPLTAEYFSRIEAIEFTIKQDDGAQPQNLSQAHMVLLGVSRSGKTPLSIYLAQKGYKVANVPIVMGVDLPKSLFQVSQEKIYALTINPAVLHSIRTSRATSLGFCSVMKNNYSVMDHVRQELDFASRIYSQNPLWPVIDVTGNAIEEIAAVVIRIYHDRKQKSSMPGIFKRY